MSLLHFPWLEKKKKSQYASTCEVNRTQKQCEIGNLCECPSFGGARLLTNIFVKIGKWRWKTLLLIFFKQGGDTMIDATKGRNKQLTLEQNSR